MSYPADLSGPSTVRPITVPPPPPPPPPAPSAPPPRAADAESSSAAQRQRELAELQARLQQMREQIAAMLERLRQAQEAEAAARAQAEAARDAAERSQSRDDIARAEAAEATAATRKAELNEAALELDAHDKRIALDEAKAETLREPGPQNQTKVDTAQAAYDDAQQLHTVAVADVNAKRADEALAAADRAVTALAPPGSDPNKLNAADQQALSEARETAGAARRQSDSAAAALETEWRRYERDAAQRELARTGRELEQAGAARERARSEGDAAALQRADDAYGAALDAWWVADREAAAAQASWDAQVAANDLAAREEQHRVDETRANQCLVEPPEVQQARQTLEQRNTAAQAALTEAQSARDDQAARKTLRDRAAQIDTEYREAQTGLEQARTAYEGATNPDAREKARIAYADAQDRMHAARGDHDALQALRSSQQADAALVEGLRAQEKGGAGAPHDDRIATLRESASQARANLQGTVANANGDAAEVLRQGRTDEWRKDGGAAQRALPTADEAAANAAQTYEATVRRPGATQQEIDTARERRDETRLAQAVAHGRSDALASTEARRAAEGEYALALEAHRTHDFSASAPAGLLAPSGPSGPLAPSTQPPGSLPSTGPSLSTSPLLTPSFGEAARPAPWTVLPPGIDAAAGNASGDTAAAPPTSPTSTSSTSATAPLLAAPGSPPVAVKENGRWYVQYPAQFSAQSPNLYGSYPAAPTTLSLPGQSPSRVELDPVTARVWEAHAQLQSAIAAEDTAWRDYETLNNDAQAIAQARREGNASANANGASPGQNPGADADPELTRLTAQVDTDHRALLAALGARLTAEDRARDLGVDVEKDETVVSAGEALESARATASASAAELERYRSERDSGAASDDVERLRNAHQAWKREHPFLREQDAPTWAPLQQALDNEDAARQQLVQEAAQAGAAQETRALTATLTPEEREDPAALYELFVSEPRAMAQGVINQHYVDYGGRPYEMAGRTHARNMAGLALGIPPEVQLAGDADAQMETLRKQDVFAGIDDDYADMLDVVADQLIEQGGEHARVTLLPVVYASRERGIVRTMLFKVETDQGPRFVDEAGRAYDDLKDYRENNTLPAADAVLAMPRDGEFTVDSKGNIELEIGDARIESGWESFRRKTHLDTIAAGVGIVAGVVLVVGSGGALAPVAMAAAGAATAYGVGTSAASIADQISHGQSWNPDKNPQMLIDGLNILAAALGVRAGVAGVSAARSGQRALVAESRGLTDEASQLALRTQALQQQATRSGRQALAVGAGTYGYTAYSAVSNWENMTPGERATTRTQLLLGGVQFMINPVSGRWIRQGATGALAGTRHAATAWRGTVAGLDRGAQALSTLTMPLRNAMQTPLAAARMRLGQWQDTLAQRLPALSSLAGFPGSLRRQGADPAGAAQPPATPGPSAAQPRTETPPHSYPVARTRWRAVQDRLSRVDTLGMLNWLDAGRRGAAQAIGKQRDAEAKLVRAARETAFEDGQALQRWLSGPMRQQMRQIEARAQSQLARLRWETDTARQQAIVRDLRRLDAAAQRLATRWHPLLAIGLRQELRRIEANQRDFKGSGDVLAPRAEAMRHLRGELAQWRAALPSRQTAPTRDTAPLAQAQALVTRLGGHRAALTDGAALVAKTLDAMRVNRDAVLDFVPKGSTRPVRASIEGDIHAVAPRRSADPNAATPAMPALPPRWQRAVAASLRQRFRMGMADAATGLLWLQARRLGMLTPRGSLRLAPQGRTAAPGRTADGMTWSSVMRSGPARPHTDGNRTSRNGALNRLDAGRAIFYQERASALAAKAAAAGNTKSKLAAWQAFVDAVAAHSPDVARRLAAAGGVRERYQGGEAGTVRRWRGFVPSRAEARGSDSAREVRRAYAELLLAAARVRKRDTRRAAAASVRAWRQALRSANDAARVTDALSARLQTATPGTATHRALTRQHALAAQAQRLAQTNAERAGRAVFGEGGLTPRARTAQRGREAQPPADGALAALRDTHPAAWRRVLERAARQMERLARQGSADSPWQAQAVQLRDLARQAAADPRLTRVGEGVAAMRQWRRAEWQRADARIAEQQATQAWRHAQRTQRTQRGQRTSAGQHADRQDLRAAMNQAAARHRDARREALAARRAAFRPGTGAIDRLAVANPRAADSLLAWAQRQQRADARLGTVSLGPVRQRLERTAPTALQGGLANASGDSTLTVAQIRRGLQRGARVAALAHGAYAAATGQVDVSRDPRELRKYNLPDTTRIDGWQITFRSRDGLNSMTLWLNIGGIKSLWVGGSTTPFAFSRDGKTTVGTRDGVNIVEGGVAYRFGLPWLSKMGMASLRVGHVKHNILRTNFANGRLTDVDGQATWSWPVTPVLMDATNIGPLRFYGSNTANRLQIGQYGSKVGPAQLWYLKGPDLSKSRVSEIDAITLNKEFQWPDLLGSSGRDRAASAETTHGAAPRVLAERRATAPTMEAPHRNLSRRAAAVLAGYHQVAPGDTLWDIARSHRDTLLTADRSAGAVPGGENGQTLRALDHLLQLNASIGDPDRIVPGWLVDIAPPQTSQG
ncbi:LWXIA domain-containing protein [Cupriavidus gilardii]|uniref:LWXIA domain-containing protein n=1 Tax=Cupriavidus gilardii TaxID=82541 RepID=UPI0021C140D1|nr:LWXIA domain-containing protein [Cupriavidus gilardii]MCT9117828.1 LWXIA domain-containing protein [Cupriavidus gilardii]